MEPALEWLENTHMVDLMSTQGVLAALQLEPQGEIEADLIVHLVLCESPPSSVMANIERDRRYQRAVGRYPSHRGVYEQLAFLPYESVLPFNYSFELDEPAEAPNG
jgi:hypothetical protein